VSCNLLDFTDGCCEVGDGGSCAPSSMPTAGPTAAPTAGPTAGPTAAPTAGPTAGPTAAPTAGPTAGPTATPTAGPTDAPTAGPTAAPTAGPTAGPTAAPTPALIKVKGTIIVGGLTLAEATANEGVIVAAIADLALVKKHKVSVVLTVVTTTTNRRRKLLADTAVLISYTLAGPHRFYEVVAAIDSWTTTEVATAVNNEAATAGVAAVFDALTVSAVSKATVTGDFPDSTNSGKKKSGVEATITIVAGVFAGLVVVIIGAVFAKKFAAGGSAAAASTKERADAAAAPTGMA
jgi:hypothetical protein